jgi:hypothetical protein
VLYFVVAFSYNDLTSEEQSSNLKIQKEEMKMKLTTKEIKALAAIAQNATDACCSGPEPKRLLDDNFSWFTVEDITAITGYSKHSVTGLMSTLNDKGLIGDFEGDGTGWCMTEAGINEAQEIWESRIENLYLNLSGPELVKAYNEMADKINAKGKSIVILVKRFATRAAGLARVEKLAIELGELKEVIAIKEDKKQAKKPAKISLSTTRDKGAIQMCRDAFFRLNYEGYTRKEFVSDCVKLGIKKSTASRNWFYVGGK